MTEPADGRLIEQLRSEISGLHETVAAADADRDRLDTALNEALCERDDLNDLLDQFAWSVAPIEVIGEHSSGNDPWANAMEIVTPAADVEQLRADRDRLAGVVKQAIAYLEARNRISPDGLPAKDCAGLVERLRSALKEPQEAPDAE
ncbi:hypothetical protein [Actinomadura rudentiformis]|uniref:Uncharacterized protein n=1 Tax=Actinomadura rudentiformis TaxID=359158 RepID=A0A6H9Z0B4_9ACTN|nr:hypothetical protein [Actinomadura rudentiformis]KAB2347301.1 hypothetical protein F8566_20015 [Actinomadura rudentiformis]